jgi:hypothetical protein
MDYVILNYADDGSLTHWAIIFGKNNLELINTKNEFNLYRFIYGDNTFYLPVKRNNQRIKLNQSKVIFAEYPFLSEFKKIISLPNLIDNDLLSTYKDEILIQVLFLGDPATFEYKSPVKIITSVKPNVLVENNFIFDRKLCLPFFFYKNQLSLVDFQKLDKFKMENPIDKVFSYSRRVDEVHSNLRDRRYFANLLKSKMNLDKFELFTAVHNNVELSRIQFGLYHLANFFDYNQYMFNLVFETQNVDYSREDQNWISEKTTFALLFCNAFFLFANQYVLNSLKELNIRILNDEFEGRDIEQKFINFIEFINSSSLDERMKLFLKMNKVNLENRTKLLDYIYSPKKSVIEFLIN